MTVGSPKVSSTNAAGDSARSTAVLPIRSPTRPPVVARIFRTTEYASGCTLEESSGSSPSAIRRNPAHCS